jgi:hypothetical protein
MVVLRFLQDESSSAAMKAEELKQAHVDETTTRLEFENFCFDENIVVRAVIDLFHRAFKKSCMLKALVIKDCTKEVDEILHLASSLDMFDKISFSAKGGEHELSNQGFWSISAAMKFNKRLTKLNLEYMEITNQQAVALGEGLITSSSPHFKELRMHLVEFEDGAIPELASGLKHNSSLCILIVIGCDIGDVELAVLIGAVESHPSLKTLSLNWNGGEKHALVALGKVLASRSCRLEELEFSGNGDDGLTGWLGILAQGLQWNESLTHLDLSENGLLDRDIDDLGQILATCKLQWLDLSDNEMTHNGFVTLTQNIPKSLKRLDFSGNHFDKEEVACHTLTLFEEHQQLWDDGFFWNYSKSPLRQKIQHFKDLNRCGTRKVLLAHAGGAIPLSIWPVILARANTVLEGSISTPNAIFQLLQGPALMQRSFDRESSQAARVGVGVSRERLTTSSKRPAETIDKESAKKGRS